MTSWDRWVRQPQAFWWRKALFQVHLWTGMAIGLYVVGVCVTGSVLVYHNELAIAFSPQPRYVVGTGQPPLGREAIEAAVQQAYPDHTISAIAEGEVPNQAYEVTLAQGDRRIQRLFHPYSGEDIGNRLPFGYRVMAWTLDLHDNLLYGRTGRLANGVGSALLGLLCLTGAVIWWPGSKSWRRSLLGEWRANWKRVTWSLHAMLGFWTFAFVLMWALSGVYLSWPQPFMAAVDWLEPFDETSLELRMGDEALAWLTRLHFGRFGGALTKALWALLGLVPPALFVTGAIIWWNRVVVPARQKARRRLPAVGRPAASI
jgi:uncharacterized iron-regulated membrane protein